jgi:hypothetical protein
MDKDALEVICFFSTIIGMPTAISWKEDFKGLYAIGWKQGDLTPKTDPRLEKLREYRAISIWFEPEGTIRKISLIDQFYDGSKFYSLVGYCVENMLPYKTEFDANEAEDAQRELEQMRRSNRKPS